MKPTRTQKKTPETPGAVPGKPPSMDGTDIPDILPDECWWIDADPSFMEFVAGVLSAFGDDCELVIDNCWLEEGLGKALSSIAVETQPLYGGMKRYRIELAERASDLGKIALPVPLVAFCGSLFVFTGGHPALMWFDVGGDPIHAASGIDEKVVASLAAHWNGRYGREVATPDGSVQNRQEHAGVPDSLAGTP
ncbi:MAG: hypothetical protein IJS32_05995 [Kiritimatiellae bacterium]|nr:hypothetical protein [Kiritimatiellia bacterium]